MAGPNPRASDSVGPSGTWDFAFLTNARVMLMLLVWDSHFETHCPGQWRFFFQLVYIFLIILSTVLSGTNSTLTRLQTIFSSSGKKYLLNFWDEFNLFEASRSQALYKKYILWSQADELKFQSSHQLVLWPRANDFISSGPTLFTKELWTIIFSLKLSIKSIVHKRPSILPGTQPVAVSSSYHYSVIASALCWFTMNL